LSFSSHGFVRLFFEFDDFFYFANSHTRVLDLVHASLVGQRGTAAIIYVVLVGAVLQRGTAAALTSCPFEPLVSSKIILGIQVRKPQPIADFFKDAIVPSLSEVWCQNTLSLLSFNMDFRAGPKFFASVLFLDGGMRQDPHTLVFNQPWRDRAASGEICHL
jgi:hypothetical protein